MKIITILLFCFVLQSCSSVKNMQDNPYNAPFDGKRFYNIEPLDSKGLLTVLKWRLTGDRANWEDEENQTFTKPSVQRSETLKLTLIGHATVLVQVNNINILTDPHFSQRSSVVTWAGPRRIIQPSIKFEDLPPIDVVLISHNHYDHLDLPSLKKLSDKFSPTVLVGLGNNELLKSAGIDNVHELDWWQTFDYKGLPIHFTPVQHWSARGLFDQNTTLWGGFYIEATKKIFFAGDTGYGKVFKMINQKYGDMDVGLIPIGAYEPRWFMKDTHVNPEEAAKIFMDLNLKKALGIHFATFKDLTDEAKLKPSEDLKAALLKFSINQNDFIAPVFGKEYTYE